MKKTALFISESYNHEWNANAGHWMMQTYLYIIDIWDFCSYRNKLVLSLSFHGISPKTTVSLSTCTPYSDSWELTGYVNNLHWCVYIHFSDPIFKEKKLKKNTCKHVLLIVWFNYISTQWKSRTAAGYLLPVLSTVLSLSLE